jgi:peptidoglycan/LPS O-acetylase OafA/YrhL
LGLILFSLHKKTETTYFDVSQTVQLKGLAIFFVVLGHFWTYIFFQKPLIFSSYAVSIFLILSGIGHGILYKTGKFEYKNFIHKTIKRIFIPYWICTLLFLVLDFYLLDRTYSVNEILLTSLGINMNPGNRIHLDLTRWFITLLLLWYFVFCFARSLFSKQVAYILYAVAFLLIVIRYYEIWSLGNVHNILAFPVGFSIGHNHSRIMDLFHNNNIKQKGVHCVVFLLICLGVLLIKTSNLDNFFLFESVEKVLKLLLLSYFLVIFFSLKKNVKFQSRILFFLGQTSYGLYLLNLPFIHRYNPLDSPFLLNHTIIAFYILLILLISLSLLVNALSKKIRLFLL